MASRKKLRTRDRGQNLGEVDSAGGLLCQQDEEALSHLFINSPLSRAIWQQVGYFCCISQGEHSWVFEISWLVGKFIGKSFHKSIRKDAWAAMICYISQDSRAYLSCLEHIHLMLGSKAISLFLLR
ncbi:hypothetical protein Acr_00g0075430 [Actinidia rufa]|uniref:Uncharacterized protein n=1 Tax=Actinidia rufa TaxID=165716 RepID=A0A7J0DV37_9ERIC|nr:hypothetical protein Acr_00g0075430 [Actinidia rufa]